MALITTSPDYGYSLLPYFHIPKDLIAKAKTLKVMVEQATPGKVQIKYLGKVYGTVEIKGPALTLAKQGQLGPMSLDSIKGQLKKHLEAAVAEATTDQGYADPSEVPGTVESSSSLKKLNDPIKTMLGKKASDANPADKTQAFVNPKVVGEVVDLDVASEPYQQVKGTSTGSKYYVLGVYNGMNLAARVLQSSGSYKLSLRAEGDAVKTYGVLLEDMGMDSGIKINKGAYYSGHYDVDSLSDVYKAMGAILGRIGFSKAVKFADPEKLVKVCL